MDKLKTLVEQWVRPEIRAISAYHVPNPGTMIKLDAMENPYRWPAAIVDEWLTLLRDVELNRYPDPGARKLKAHLREAMGVPEGMELLLGNGSDELIQMMAMAVAAPGRSVLAPEPGFVMYQMIATFCALEYVGVPLAADFSLDLPAMLAAIEQHQPAIIFLAYPNNPTGNLFDAKAIEAILNKAEGLVVLDEAYHAFAEQSFMGRLGEFPNLVVMRTVSKLGLAGLRLGLLAGPREWLDEFDKVRLPYNINVLTQASGEFALSHRAIFDEQTARLRRDRELLAGELASIDGLTVYPSRANFILFRVPTGKGDLVFEGLKERKVLIKNLNRSGGPLKDCLRVTVGTPEENNIFLAALRATLAWVVHR
jgi:histidinol-phosphate aminotransferase